MAAKYKTASEMKLYRVILPVNSIQDATTFYGRVLNLSGTRVSPGRHYFDLEGTILALYDPLADGDDQSPEWSPHFNQYIYISVQDLTEVFKNVQQSNMVNTLTEISEMPWGERLFYFTDPWRNPICFVDETTVFKG